MSQKFYKFYLAPAVEVIEISVELGFQGSSNVEDPKEDETLGW